MKEHVSEIRRDVAEQMHALIERRNLTSVFQPIFHFREGRILGYEALVRGPEGSLIETPLELFAAAHAHGLTLELNIVCIQEILRAFARRGLDGRLFVNASPQLILQRGFSQDRAARFLGGLGITPERVVIELTEDYPTSDFRTVHESLMLYRAMGFQVAIDDLGEGFASLRLWSELRPEFVKADKHFVAGIARDPVKVQFLRAIEHIAESCGSLVIAEGIENAADFKVAKDLGIACGQGWFIGRPEETPARALSAEAAEAFADARVPVMPSQRLRAGSEPHAQDYLRAVDAASAQSPLSTLLERFAAAPALCAIPVSGANGIEGVVSRNWLDALALIPDAGALRAQPCIEFADRLPIRVEADLDLAALTAILVESDARRFADGFVISHRGRYLGMGTSRDVMRSLQSSQVLAARYTNPLTLLPGQVPINEHLERLLESAVKFTAWFAEVDQMRGLNDEEGFQKGDALIHSAARALEGACEPGFDFVGHISGSRFVVLMQSEDWRRRADEVIAAFPGLVGEQVSPEACRRGYFAAKLRDGRLNVRPLPRLAIGILPVLPGVFESRHEVLAVAKQAAHAAMRRPGNSAFVDERHANAYPQSVLFG